ncbi:retropepsin-like aspartic protease family protein [Methylobacterium sp. sgz302541]|uniref:retropepsin-like aspartic protease family protein n=1 Tax=unclassified Methylobacterium TaxID=2615210 RepID=UPI003D332C8C
MMYLGLIAIGLVLAVLILTDGSSSIGGVIEPDQLAGLAWGGTILTLVVAGFWHQFRERIGENLRNLLIWLALGLACVLAFSYRDRMQSVGGRLLGDLRPGTAVVGPGGSVTVTRRANGEFRVEAEVNGRTQSFAFDTGASAVVLTAENAAALGIRPEPGEFSSRVSTANGTAFTAPILLDSLSIGPITERRVDAMVAKPGALSGNLLGQSFLTRLPSYEVRGDRLILNGR